MADSFALDGITLAQAQANLEAWVKCSQAVARNQAYTITVDGSSREYTRANADHLSTMIDYWQAKVRAISAAQANGGRRRGIRISRGVPL
ncbi:MAG: DUF6148 family protein [Reyranellaceae bacterium]